MQPDPEITDKLLAFIRREFPDAGHVGADTQLMPGVIDSLGVFVLTDFVEHELGVRLDDVELDATNLATTRALANLIAAKRQHSLKSAS